jgi:ureidoglycolate dehydrogenase (NAD+)
MATREHLIGIAMTHADSIVVPHGGARRFFGTNPISIAVPRASGEAVCLDMATSQVAWNKVKNARLEGKPLPEGIAVDANGIATTDAHAAEAAVPLGGPVYGYKGYGLAFLIDILCGMVNGMSYGPRLTRMYDELEKPRKIGHFLIAIDPARFAGAETLEATVDQLVAELRGHGEILYPGEPEERAQAERRVAGIPIDAEALADMDEWSRQLGIPKPTEH